MTRNTSGILPLGINSEVPVSSTPAELPNRDLDTEISQVWPELRVGRQGALFTSVRRTDPDREHKRWMRGLPTHLGGLGLAEHAMEADMVNSSRRS